VTLVVVPNTTVTMYSCILLLSNGNRGYGEPRIINIDSAAAVISCRCFQYGEYLITVCTDNTRIQKIHRSHSVDGRRQSHSRVTKAYNPEATMDTMCFWLEYHNFGKVVGANNSASSYVVCFGRSVVCLISTVILTL
jgi:hypothetical protein